MQVLHRVSSTNSLSAHPLLYPVSVQVQCASNIGMPKQYASSGSTTEPQSHLRYFDWDIKKVDTEGPYATATKVGVGCRHLVTFYMPLCFLGCSTCCLHITLYKKNHINWGRKEGKARVEWKRRLRLGRVCGSPRRIVRRGSNNKRWRYASRRVKWRRRKATREGKPVIKYRLILLL